MRIPYIVLTEPILSGFVRDSCINPWTRSGDALYDQSKLSVGTLADDSAEAMEVVLRVSNIVI
jgi:hypothetical protein